MRSLRGRVGTLVAVGLMLLTAAAAVGIMAERWREERTGLGDDVEFAAFRLSEADDLTRPTVDLPGGVDEFAVSFNEFGEVLGTSRDLPEEFLLELRNDVYEQTEGPDVIFTIDDFTGSTPRMIVAGVGCIDAAVCDTVVVGATEATLSSYLGARVLWLVGPALLAALLGAMASRWIVGRSLRPVERMRAELDQITDSDLARRVPVPGSGDELERLGESMNATLDRLGAAISANERFTADAAHELRSPIAGVRAALEVEAGRRPSGLLDDSIAELDRASRLVDDLLVLARRQGRLTLTEDVDLDDLTRSALNVLRARRPDLAIEARLEPCRVRGDADALLRVITNLLDNAARHGNGRVSLWTGGSGTQAWVRVDDNGPGVREADRSVIFERFTRLDVSRARATGGSGLGLAIAKELADSHGGTITIASSPLGGAVFALILPR